MNQNYFEPNSFGFDQPSQYSINPQPSIIQEDLNQKLISGEFMTELRNELFTSIQSVVEMSRQREQATNLSNYTSEPSRHFNSIRYDDDDEERTIPLCDIISQLPPSIVITTSPPVLPTKDPEDSLIMENEELSTIPKKELDEFIKSSVEALFQSQVSPRIHSRVTDYPDLEASRALGFVHHPLKLQSFAYGNLISLILLI
nr:hypothetical protein [Tanacetum cinerariifolium]